MPNATAGFAALPVEMEMEMPQGMMRVNSTSTTVAMQMPMHIRVATPGSEILSAVNEVTPYGAAADEIALPETATSVPLPMSQDECPIMAGNVDAEADRDGELYGAGVTPVTPGDVDTDGM